MDFDLDYNILFSTNSANLSEPVVFIFGWLGCKDRYLEKYAEIYHKFSMTSIRYTSPTSITFWKPEKLQTIGVKLYQLVYDIDIQDHPIIFHIFSGNGCFVYDSFCDAMRRAEDTKLNIAGIIFDSAPSSGGIYTKALAYIYAEHSNSHWLAQCFLLLIYLALFAVLRLVSCLRFYFNNEDNFTNYRRRRPFMLDNHDCRAQLYLYSDADFICTPTVIETFAEKQKLLGAAVYLTKFKDSPHCQHFRFYPDEYLVALKDFIEQICNKTD